MADDVLILGGGVIGLSLAYELAGHDLRVRLLERGTPGQEASWAGAGILPPAVDRPEAHPLERLAGISHALHPQWAEQLRDETGIDNGFCRCGGLYLARTPGAAQELPGEAAVLQQTGLEAIALDQKAALALEPQLDRAAVTGAIHLPDECQIRNPRHIKALLSACLRRGVQIETGAEVHRLETSADRVTRVRTVRGDFSADRVCLTGGAWTGRLLAELGRAVSVEPIRGQIVLLNAPGVFRRVLNDGSRYLVPRSDGRVLVGSTEERAGFEKRNTPEGVAGLLQLATELLPALSQATLERTWSGLRPHTADGLPYLGRLPDLANAYIAAGHFRAGLHLSTGTARVMGQLLRDQQPEIDLAAFSLNRHVETRESC